MGVGPVLDITKTCPYTPPVEYVRLREQAPVVRVTLPGGLEGWAVTRLAEARQLYADPRLSSDRLNPNYPFMTGAAEAEALRFKLPLVGMDQPEHRVVRKAVSGAFSVPRMAQLRPRIQQIVGEHLETMLAGPQPADLVKELALPVPSLVICEGVPYSDHEFFQQRTASAVDGDAPAEDRVRGTAEIRTYLRELVERKKTEPGDDLLSSQVTVYGDLDELADLGWLLLLAGHETTANMISLRVVTLLEHPDVLAMIRADSSKTLTVIEEVLRYFAIAEFASARVAVEDIDIAGVTIRAGDPVVLLGSAANRDPDAFGGAKADEFDAERGARHHVTFGYGPHQCIGQHLARLELQITFDTLFARIPTLRLEKPSTELRYKERSIVFGIHELPVSW